MPGVLNSKILRYGYGVASWESAISAGDLAGAGYLRRDWIIDSPLIVYIYSTDPSARAMFTLAIINFATYGTAQRFARGNGGPAFCMAGAPRSAGRPAAQLEHAHGCWE